MIIYLYQNKQKDYAMKITIKELKSLIQEAIQESLLSEAEEKKQKPLAVSVWKQPESKEWSGHNLKHGDSWKRTGKKAKNGMVEVEHGEGKKGWASEKALARLEDK